MKRLVHALLITMAISVLPLSMAAAKDPNNTTDPKCARAWTVNADADSFWACKRTGYMFRSDGSDIFVFHQASTSPPLRLRLQKPSKVTSDSITWGKKRYNLNCAGSRPVCVLELA
jgi:hypothetical protein